MSRKLINIKVGVSHKWPDGNVSDEVHAGRYKLEVVEGGYEVRGRGHGMPNILFVPREMAIATFEEKKP